MEDLQRIRKSATMAKRIHFDFIHRPKPSARLAQLLGGFQIDRDQLAHPPARAW